MNKPCFHTVKVVKKNRNGRTKYLLLTDPQVVNVETGAELGVNQDGEIWVRGPLIMKGYHNNQKATDGTINKDGWLMTGESM
jgi:long-subunit acyl-CoA synthetase (AMP-forming)